MKGSSGGTCVKREYGSSNFRRALALYCRGAHYATRRERWLANVAADGEEVLIERRLPLAPRVGTWRRSMQEVMGTDLRAAVARRRSVRGGGVFFTI